MKPRPFRDVLPAWFRLMACIWIAALILYPVL